jgi:ribosome biogenesis GTPase A
MYNAVMFQLKEIYKIDEDFSTPDQFLALLAKSMGRFKKGGVAHTNAAARCLIQDWNM